MDMWMWLRSYDGEVIDGGCGHAGDDRWRCLSATLVQMLQLLMRGVRGLQRRQGSHYGELLALDGRHYGGHRRWRGCGRYNSLGHRIGRNIIETSTGIHTGQLLHELLIILVIFVVVLVVFILILVFLWLLVIQNQIILFLTVPRLGPLSIIFPIWLFFYDRLIDFFFVMGEVTKMTARQRNINSGEVY